MSSFAPHKSADRGAGQKWPALRWALRLLPHVLAVAALGVALSVTLPAYFGYHSVTVLSGSMGEALPVGSIAVTKPVPGDSIQQGDVVAFARTGASLPVLHRVVGITDVNGQRVAATKGDANEDGDTTPLVLQGQGEVVVFHVPWIGYGAAFAQSLWARLLVLVMVGASFTLSLVRRGRVRANGRYANA